MNRPNKPIAARLALHRRYIETQPRYHTRVPMAAFSLIKRLFGTGERQRSAARPQAPRGATMLVVDDSPTIRNVLSRMLEDEGYKVSTVDSGEQALAKARELSPALIFLDIVMPGMNGFAVLRTLRKDEQTQAIPIVMISGNLQATEQFYVQRFGADDFMKKPFGRAEVYERIQQLVESGRVPRRDAADITDEALAPLHRGELDGVNEIAPPDADDPAMEGGVVTGSLMDDEPTDDTRLDGRGQEKMNHADKK